MHNIAWLKFTASVYIVNTEFCVSKCAESSSTISWDLFTGGITHFLEVS